MKLLVFFVFIVKYVFSDESLMEYVIDNANNTASLATTTTPATATQRAVNIKKKFSSLDEIKKLLKIDAIKKCAYDSNPNIVALCPHYSELLAKELNIDYKNSSNEDLISDISPYFLRMNDIESVIVNETIVNELYEKCGGTEWCLNSTSNVDFAADLLASYGSSLCLVSTCYDEMKDYMLNCAQSQLTKYLFDLLPLLCKVYLENKSKEYCLQDTLRMLHVTYAFNKKMTNSNLTVEFDVCKGRCDESCEKTSKQLNRIESCCGSIDLVKDFKAYDWYFENKNEVISKCNLPIKTICLNEGKFYVEVNQPFMYIFVASMFAFFVLVTLIFWACRRSNDKKTVRVSSTDSNYEYSQLNHGNNNSQEYDDVDDDYFDEDSFQRKFTLTNYSLTDNTSSVEIKNLLTKH